MDRKHIKNIARHNLLGHYGCVIGAAVLVGLVAVIGEYFMLTMTSSGVMGAIVGIVGALLFLIIAMLLKAGYAYIHLNLARGRQTTVRDLGYAFTNRPGRFIKYIVLIYVVAYVCVLPGVIVMVIASVSPLLVGRANILAFIGVAALIAGIIILIVIMLSWYMTVYCLIDQRNLKTIDGIKNSRVLMRGNKWKLFVLGLSFIGWLLFSILTLFIGYLWIKPYMNQSMTCFYISLLPPVQQTYGSGGPDQGYQQYQGERYDS